MPADIQRPAEPLVRLSGIRRRWGDREVLRDVDLSVDAGTVAFIGGANGAGKTTLLRIVAGVITPHAGTVSLLGLDPRRERRDYARRLGWLPAGSDGVYNRLTVRQNVAYAAAISLMPRAERGQAIDAAMEEFDITRLAANRGDRISMGERQRVRLAMTLVHQPTLVLLDEPNTSLDPAALGRVHLAMSVVADRGGAAIWCAPSRQGIDLPADVEYFFNEGSPEPC